MSDKKGRAPAQRRSTHQRLEGEEDATTMTLHQFLVNECEINERRIEEMVRKNSQVDDSTLGVNNVPRRKESVLRITIGNDKQDALTTLYEFFKQEAELVGQIPRLNDNDTIKEDDSRDKKGNSILIKRRAESPGIKISSPLRISEKLEKNTAEECYSGNKSDLSKQQRCNHSASYTDTSPITLSEFLAQGCPTFIDCEECGEEDEKQKRESADGETRDGLLNAEKRGRKKSVLCVPLKDCSDASVKTLYEFLREESERTDEDFTTGVKTDKDVFSPLKSERPRDENKRQINCENRQKEESITSINGDERLLHRKNVSRALFEVNDRIKLKESHENNRKEMFPQSSNNKNLQTNPRRKVTNRKERERNKIKSRQEDVVNKPMTWYEFISKDQKVSNGTKTKSLVDQSKERHKKRDKGTEAVDENMRPLRISARGDMETLMFLSKYAHRKSVNLNEYHSMDCMTRNGNISTAMKVANRHNLLHPNDRAMESSPMNKRNDSIICLPKINLNFSASKKLPPLEVPYTN